MKQMKQTILLTVLAVLTAFVLPLLFSTAPTETGPAPEETAAAAEPVPLSGGDAATGSAVADAALLLTVHTADGDVEMTMADYLPQALAGEMPAAFSEEALKAQAVALRTYALYYRAARKETHPEADVCTDSGCCAACLDETALREKWGAGYETYYAKLCAAVAATDGQYLVYGDEPILAVFHASSGGQTEDGTALGTAQPYLVSVSSPETAETVSNLQSMVTVSAADFRVTVQGVHPNAALDGEPSGWVGAAELDAAGRVSQVEIGGVAVSGLALCAMFNLRSTDFTLAYSDGSFVFRVSGYGHGLGMSQYGANLLAQDSATYADILSHYYPGTELVVAVQGE